ncbi:T9SS type B sorting domain-containing protein [Nonlabens antarcticus]|uniref:T9SS type B sorting domain-containing protein n=1 Tax=Nonlabens antarcticus TaxID=392714 RepID=UPI0018911955|nr:T9SS type B sorting domain-containing protein [Nonlabens antarcticus]
MIKTRIALIVLVICTVQLSYGQLEAQNRYYGENEESRYNSNTNDADDFDTYRNQLITTINCDPATINAIEIINANGGEFGSATAMVSGLGDYEFRIDENASYQESPFFNDLPPDFYTLFVNDKNGCGVTQQRFSIVGYPRFFTPNADGFNDFWQLDGVNNMFEPKAKIFIFHRYGKLLKQLLSTAQGWDGTFNGEPLPSSDYWFKATLKDGTEFSAHFSLKR